MTADADEDVEKKEHSSTVGVVINWYNYSGSQSGGSSEKLNIVLPEDPAIPLLVIYPKEAFNQSTCSTIIEALFIIAKSWKEPRYSSVEE